MSASKLGHLPCGDGGVERAAAVIQQHVFLGNLLGDVASQIAVGDEQDMRLRKCAHDLHGVGGRHAYVAPALHLDGRVHIAHHGQVIAVCGTCIVDGPLRHDVGHRAVRGRLRQEHGLVQIEQLHALAHKLHACDDQRLLGQADRQLCQRKRVAHIIGDRLHLGRHVIMSQDDGVALAFKARELFCRRGLTFGHIDSPRWHSCLVEEYDMPLYS